MYVKGGTIEMHRHMSHTTKSATRYVEVTLEVLETHLKNLNESIVSAPEDNSRLSCRPASIDNS